MRTVSFVSLCPEDGDCSKVSYYCKSHHLKMRTLVITPCCSKLQHTHTVEVQTSIYIEIKCTSILTLN